MKRDELMSKIADLEREIAVLPEGSITKKKINNKEYYYHRITRNKKRVENYISYEEASELQTQIAKRKELQKELKDLKQKAEPEEKTVRKAKKKLSFQRWCDMENSWRHRLR